MRREPLVEGRGMLRGRYSVNETHIIRGTKLWLERSLNVGHANVVSARRVVLPAERRSPPPRKLRGHVMPDAVYGGVPHA